MREKVSSAKISSQKSLGLKKLTVKFGRAFEASEFKLIAETYEASRIIKDISYCLGFKVKIKEIG